MSETEDRAEWSTAYINALPDSAFACIDAGGTKDAEGRTTPRSLRHYPHHDANGKVDPAHLANARARVEQSGTAACGRSHLFETHSLPSDQAAALAPPRDYLFRAQPHGIELRHSDDGMPTMVGHFAVFDQWTEIDSAFEGRFLERIAPGAFTKTFTEQRSAMRALFQHGKDPQIGDKVLGPIEMLEEDETGARYEVPLLDTSYNRDLLPGLQAGLYGSSFRFRVQKEDFQAKVKRSAYNPDALPERTVREAQVFEFGPVTFPAYSGATAGVRSDTDLYVFDQLAQNPERLRVLLSSTGHVQALPDDGAATAGSHSDEASRKSQPVPVSRRFNTREEYLTWITKI
jgi:HK97 family phage prohead protease